MKTSKKRNWLKWLLILVIGLIILWIVSVIILMNVYDNFDARKFDTTEWKQNHEKRFELVDDLINSKIIEGKSKSEVIGMLGEPETNAPKGEKDRKINGFYSQFPDTTGTGVDLFYFIGTRPGVLQPEQYFFIWIENDTVSKYIIRGTYN